MTPQIQQLATRTHQDTPCHVGSVKAFYLARPMMISNKVGSLCVSIRAASLSDLGMVRATASNPTANQKAPQRFQSRRTAILKGAPCKSRG